MARLGAYGRLAARFASTADFLHVYVDEAHPVDGWSSPDATFQLRAHRDLQERVDAARRLVPFLSSRAPFVVVADTMENECSAAYGAAFYRLYVLLGGKVVHESARSIEPTALSVLRRWLERHEAAEETPGSLPSCSTHGHATHSLQHV